MPAVIGAWAGSEWIEIEVLESPKICVLLGPDVLNRFLLTANGPAGIFDLVLPNPPSP